MRRIIFWATIISGTVAAYLLYRRGVPAGQIVEDVFNHPIGSLAQELHTPAPQPSEA